MNAGKEPILRTKRFLVAFWTLFLWLSSFAYADSSAPTVPPGREFKWDIGPKDSSIEQDFVVTEYRFYEFSIGFHHTSATDIKQLRQFTGDGSYHVYTKDTVNPALVIAKTAAEVARCEDLVRKGEYITKLANLGVVVPVHIKVEKLDDERNATPMLDKMVDTGATYSGGNGSIDRMITSVKLRPGKYRVISSTTKESVLPLNVETYFRIGFYPKAAVLKDNE